MAMKVRPTRFARVSAVLHSIRFRLTMWYVLILALVLLVFGSIVYTTQGQNARAELERNMRAQGLRWAAAYDPLAEGLRPTFTMKEKDTLLPESDILLILDVYGDVAQKFGNISDETVERVRAANKTAQLGDKQQIEDTLKKLEALDTSEPKVANQITKLKMALVDVVPGEDAFFPLNFSENASGSTRVSHYLFFTTPILVKNQSAGTLILGHPRDDEAQQQQLLFTLLLAAPLTLLVAAGGGYWLAARAMRPVRAITHAANEMGETEMHRRLNLGGQDELGELASTFDGMLDRLEGAFKRQRQFTADASHELRTPLAIVDLEASRALVHIHKR